MRLLFAGIALALLLAGCGGSSSTTTPTQAPAASSPSLTSHVTPSPVVTAAPSATVITGASCSASDLAGVIIDTQTASGTRYYIIGISNTGAGACTLPGAPAIGFADAGQAPIDVQVGNTGLPCGTPPIAVQTCLYGVPVELPPGSPTPNGLAFPGQVTVTVAIAYTFNWDPVPTPTYQASYLLVTFPEVGAVSIPFSVPVTLIPSGQVRLSGYGPSS